MAPFMYVCSCRKEDEVAVPSSILDGLKSVHVDGGFDWIETQFTSP